MPSVAIPTGLACPDASTVGVAHPPIGHETTVPLKSACIVQWTFTRRWSCPRGSKASRAERSRSRAWWGPPGSPREGTTGANRGGAVRGDREVHVLGVDREDADRRHGRDLRRGLAAPRLGARVDPRRAEPVDVVESTRMLLPPGRRRSVRHQAPTRPPTRGPAGTRLPRQTPATKEGPPGTRLPRHRGWRRRSAPPRRFHHRVRRSLRRSGMPPAQRTSTAGRFAPQPRHVESCPKRATASPNGSRAGPGGHRSRSSCQLAVSFSESLMRPHARGHRRACAGRFAVARGDGRQADAYDCAG